MPFETRRTLLAGFAVLGLAATVRVSAANDVMLVDDFSNSDLVAPSGNRWRGVTDRVMGGVSTGSVRHETLDGRDALRMTGTVSLENNGGFVQAAIDLGAGGNLVDVSAFEGIQVTVRGNGERYSVHLKTADTARPWQSYRAHFVAGKDWTTVSLPFRDFEAYRVDEPLDLRRLRRLGLVAIGRVFEADLAVAKIAFYRPV
ncbi:MAG: CIA30 family protein [Pseudomonadota bacterium]